MRGGSGRRISSARSSGKSCYSLSTREADCVSVSRSPSPSPSERDAVSPLPKINVERSGTPRLNVEHPTPITSGPFRDYPDDADEAEAQRADGGRTPQDMLDEQQVMMNGQYSL